MKIKGAVFDVDGTLLDSMYFWEIVELAYLNGQGVTPPPDINDTLRSLNEFEVADYYQDEFGVKQSVEEIIAWRQRLLKDFYFHKAALKDGVVPVLDALRERGVKMCIATATDKFLIEPALRRCGILDYFGKIFTCVEERTSKSSPDIFIRAAEFLGTGISETLVVEDALYAMISAKGAGFPVAAVYDLSADDQQDEIRRISDYYSEKMDGLLGML